MISILKVIRFFASGLLSAMFFLSCTNSFKTDTSSADSVGISNSQGGSNPPTRPIEPIPPTGGPPTGDPAPTGTNSDFFSGTASSTPPINVVGALNIYLDQNGFNPMTPVNSFVGVKDGAQLNLGKASAGTSTAPITLKLINDASSDLVLPIPVSTGNLTFSFESTPTLPTTLAGKATLILKVKAVSSNLGSQAGELSFESGGGQKMKIKFLLNVK